MSAVTRDGVSLLIDVCKNMRELKQLHARLITSPDFSGHGRCLLTTRLLFVCALSPFGSLAYASDVFRRISNPNLYVYNIMIRAHTSKSASCHQYACFSLYKEMLRRGVAPDGLTFPFLLKESLNDPGSSDAGRSMHCHVIKFGFCGDVFVNNSLISFYSVFADSGVVARELFEEMPMKDIVSWNSVIIGHLRRGELDEALGLFRRMKEKNAITWNSMITGFAQGGWPKEALEFFHEMEKDGDPVVKPDKITVTSALSACASLGLLDLGKRLHDYLRKSGIKIDRVIETALIDMYGKCGSIGEAFEIFRAMPSKDSMAWTAMISAFALHGCCEEAFQLLEEMENLGRRPSHVTFVALLSACTHSGSVAKGRWCFDAMKSVYGMERQVYHYACMVDILSRAGLFDEAEALILEMPMEPDSYVWGALLAGCQLHGNVLLGERVAKHLIVLNPANHVYYVSMQGVYANAGRFEGRNAIRALMDRRAIKKEIPGNSFMEIGGVVYEFSVGGGSPQVNLEGLLHVLNCLKEMAQTGSEQTSGTEITAPYFVQGCDCHSIEHLIGDQRCGGDRLQGPYFS